MNAPVRQISAAIGGSKLLQGFEQLLTRIRTGESLPADQAEVVMDAVVSGALTQTQVSDYLIALADKGESVSELVGSARSLRRHAIPFECNRDRVIDNCGTGGDGAGTFNISTVAAIVIAAAGQPVVKHGNRSASGRVGSADLLEALGLPIRLPVAAVQQCLNLFGFAFLFAPSYHPAAKSVAPIRRQIGRPTIFNWLGPLCNPAQPAFQLIGAPSVKLAETLAQALVQLGIHRAFVIASHAGTDELMHGENHLFVVEGSRLREEALRTTDLGLTPFSPTELKGGDAVQNAAITLEVLEGTPGPARDVVLLNAAAALVCTGAAKNLADGCRQAAVAIDRGIAADLLHRLRKFQEAGPQ